MAWSSLPDRLQPGPAQGVRLPGAQPQVPPARALLGQGDQLAAHAQAGQVPHPAGQAHASTWAARASRSGRSWATTASSARSSACRSPSRRRSSTARMLAAMCVPDLKGSQGTFSYYSSDPEEQDELHRRHPDPGRGQRRRRAELHLGPREHDGQGRRGDALPFEVRLDGDGADAELVIDKKSYPLKPREFTPWIESSSGRR